MLFFGKLFGKKNKDEPWETSAIVRESDRKVPDSQLDADDLAWAESVLEAKDFQARLAKLGFRLGDKNNDWTPYDQNNSRLFALSYADDADSDVVAEYFVKNVNRIVDNYEVLRGFYKYYRRAIAVGWEPILEDIDPNDPVIASIEVDRPVDYDYGNTSDDYEEHVVYPFSTVGLRQFVLELTDEEVWRSLMPYFEAIDQLGWRIVKDVGKFVLYTNLDCYERVLHPDQVEWLARMIDTKGLSGDLLGTMLQTPQDQLTIQP